MEGHKHKPASILLFVVMLVSIAALIILHVDPKQTLLGMLIGVFVLVIVLDGGKQRRLKKSMGPAIEAEIKEEKVHLADITDEVLALLKGGKKFEAVKRLHQQRKLTLAEARDKLDEIHLRLSMGQQVHPQHEDNTA